MNRNSNDTAKRRILADKLLIFGRPNVRYSISLRFLSFVVLVVLLSGSVVGLVMVINSRAYLSQQALLNNLNQANLAASFASNYITAIEAHVQVFAKRPDIRQAIINGTPQQIQETLAAFVEIQTPLNGVGVYDTKAIQLTYSSTGATTIGQSFIDRNWFQGVMATGQPYLGEPILAKANNVPVVTYAVPMLDEQGQIRAVLSAGISLQKLSDALVAIGFNSDTRASMIDNRNGGLIIADSNPAFLLMPVSGDTEAVSRLLAGQSGMLETTNSNGKPDLAGVAQVADLPWGIMVVTPRDAAYEIVNSLTRRASIYAGLVILASAILGVIFVLQITKPILRLVKATKEIGSGNLDFKVDMLGKNEIGDLSRAFSDMTVKLKNTMVSRDELIKEVDERKRAEQSLKESEDLIRTTFRYAPVGIATLTPDFQFKTANQAFCRILGYAEDELKALVYKNITHPDDLGESARLMQALAKGEISSFSQEKRYLSKDGRVITCKLVVTLLLDPVGKPLLYIEELEDITERKVQELEKEEFAKQLEEKNTELERFTYTVSHDLKSPLVTIKTFLGYLNQDITGSDTSRIEKDMLFMHLAADKMEKLLGELLEMSRVGRVVNPPVEITFDELVQESLSLVAGQITEKGVQVKASNESVKLYGDRPRLVEIWQNLVDNAVKFTGNQASPRIDIGVEYHPNETVFYVRDNGIGIEPQYHSKLFHLFEKIDPKTEGTGMGLAITKRIVELYQGRIWVESKGLGQGTGFFFTIPGALKHKEKGL